jgi:hypothetical protein
VITKQWADENIGAGVVYTPMGGRAEDGVIVRANLRGAFVRYRGSETPQLTAFTDLDPLTPEALI